MSLGRTRRIGLTIVAVVVSATGAIIGSSGIAGAATAVPVLTAAPTTTSGGVTLPTYTDSQIIEASVAANTTFGSRVGISIIECADPGGSVANLPTSAANCDGQTLPGDTILTGTDGSFDYLAGGNAGNYSGLTMFLLPSTALGEPANANPKCDATHACVLYIGTNQNDFTQPKVFSSPFYVSASAPAGTPEAPYAVMLPVAAVLVAAGAFFAVRRRTTNAS